MSRLVGRPVPVEEGPDHAPRAFTYNGVRYYVAEILHRWHLQDRWWSKTRHSDREYYRVVTSDHQVFELYADVAKRPHVWILDVIQD
jgi:hypothetical protein